MSIDVVQGDITTFKCDAIVNAANSSLLGGGGVDGAIHRAGGASILVECRIIRNTHGGCKTGEAVLTTAGDLPAKNVIHTVGPVWRGGNHNEEHLLANCYINSLKLADEHGLKVIAFPNISTGVYGFPKELAVQIAVKTVQECLKKQHGMRIIFVCFNSENYELYQQTVTLSADRVSMREA